MKQCLTARLPITARRDMPRSTRRRSRSRSSKGLKTTRFIGCFTRQAQPDYKGTLKGGRSVIFEAKYTSTDRITQDRVSDAQWSYMDRATELGARCFVLAGFKSGGIYRIPWPVWSDMKRKFGHKYVTENDLSEYRISKSWNDMLLILD